MSCPYVSQDHANEAIRKTIARCEGSGGGLDADAAGDGADFDTAAGSADMGAKRMLVLVFDDDRNIGANFAGNGFGGEMETGVFWNGNFDAAGCGLEMPVRVAGGIAGDFNSTGSAAGLDVVIGADNPRSEEHTSELQSPCNLVCRLLLEKKKEHT